MELSRTRTLEGSRHSSLKPLARWGTALAASAALAVSFAPSASAADATDGTLTWGVKQSFRSYVVGPIASGEITTSDGATQADGNGEFDFSSGTGTVDDDGSADLSFSGTVNFYGHDGELDVDLGNPTLSLESDGTGELSVDYVSPEGDESTVVIADVEDAELDVSGDTATLEGASATLTADGVDVFSYQGSGFYEEGTELDALSAEVSLGEGAGGGDDDSDDGAGDDDGADDGAGDDAGEDDGTEVPAPEDPGTDDGTDEPVNGPVVETDIV